MTHPFHRWMSGEPTTPESNKEAIDFIFGTLKLLDITSPNLKQRLDDAIEKTEQVILAKEQAKEISVVEGSQTLLSRVHPKLLNNRPYTHQFKMDFKDKTIHSMSVMSIDIRKSTSLMLKSKPLVFTKFITELCEGIFSIIRDNYGILDKFTGDGILCYYPEKYSGQDALFYSIQSAKQCHDFFNKHYEKYLINFNSALDTGLGIGIDFGDVNLLMVLGGLTIIGDSVVYACRMSDTAANTTSLNYPAFHRARERYGEYIEFEMKIENLKNEGLTRTYKLSSFVKEYTPIKPVWA